MLFLNIVVKPIYILAIDAQVQNRVGNEDYGLYFAIFNFSFLFAIVLDLGIQNYNSKNVSQNREQITEEFAYIFGIKLVLALVYLLVLFVFGKLVGYSKNEFPLLLGIGAIMFFQSLYIYLRSHFSALGFFNIETYLSAFDKILMILILGYFLYIRGEININLFVKGQVLALIIACMVALILLGKKFKICLRFSVRKSKELFHHSLPFALVFLLMTLYTRMDGVMLERMIDDNGASAGIYATGYRLLDAGNMLGYLFSVLLLPMFAKQLGDKADINPLVRTAGSLLFVIVTMVSLMSWFYAEEIMNLIYSSITEVNIRIFQILMLGFWFMCMSYVYGALITASGKLKQLNYIFILGIMLNWVLNLYLIPRQGPVGAAVATLTTQSLVFLGQFVLATKRFNLQFPPELILKVACYVGITFAFVKVMNTNIQLFWLVELIIITVFLLAVSFLMGLFRLSWTNSN